MYRAMEGFSTQTVPLPAGDRGTRKTVAAMRTLADRGSRDLAVRAAVIRALGASGAAPHNIPAQVRAWFEYVKNGIFFLHDPVATEWLQSPRYTLASGAGDCDDRATLLAAGLKSFGVPASFKAVAVDPRRPRSFSHVYVVANVMGRAIALDPTYDDNAMGDEPQTRMFRTWMVPA